MSCYLVIWGFGRILYLTFLVPVFPVITTVNLVYPISWFVSTVFLLVYFLKADWVHGFDSPKSAR